MLRGEGSGGRAGHSSEGADEGGGVREAELYRGRLNALSIRQHRPRALDRLEADVLLEGHAGLALEVRGELRAGDEEFA